MAHRLPLQPREEASKECLADRQKEVYRELRNRGYSDFASLHAIDRVADEGMKSFATGEAYARSPEHRAGWIWCVGLTAARRFTAREAMVEFCSLESIRDLADKWLDDDLPCEEIAILYQELDSLPDEKREVIHLYDLCGYSSRQVAEMLKLTPAGVLVRRRSALKALSQAVLARLGFFPENAD